MPSSLDSVIKDIVQQIGDAHEILDQRHYRLLLNLPSNEKVDCVWYFNLFFVFI